MDTSDRLPAFGVENGLQPSANDETRRSQPADLPDMVEFVLSQFMNGAPPAPKPVSNCPCTVYNVQNCSCDCLTRGRVLKLPPAEMRILVHVVKGELQTNKCGVT